MSFEDALALAHRTKNVGLLEQLHAISAERKPARVSLPPPSFETKVKEKKRSRGEIEMEAMLTGLTRSGEISRFAHECLRLKVGESNTGRDAWYLPDFICWLPDGRQRGIEVKGEHKWEDSIVKFKAAVLLYPEIDWQMWERSAEGWRRLH